VRREQENFRKNSKLLVLVKILRISFGMNFFHFAPKSTIIFSGGGS
jgi:hypothetical protein